MFVSTASNGETSLVSDNKKYFYEATHKDFTLCKFRLSLFTKAAKVPVSTAAQAYASILET